jgi:hypothetical protein
MKFLLLLTSLSLLCGCGIIKLTESVEPPRPGVASPVPGKVKLPVELKGKKAIFQLLNRGQLSLQLRNIDTGEALTLLLEGELSERKVPKGHWELAGFEDSGKSFVSMNTSKKFIFQMKPSKSIYAGSIVVGCPRVQSKDLKLLMSMRFFNRYPFSSSDGLCEVIVGDNFNRIKKLRKKIPGDGPLWMGF